MPVTANQDINAFAQSTAIERIWFYQQAEDRWYRWHKNGKHSTAATALKTLSPDSIYWVYTPREQLISAADGINATRYFLHNNHLGSVALTTDDQGKLHTQAHYLPYGAYAPVTEAKTDLAKHQPYGFSGKELDGSGLMYFEARYYDPLTTRFVTPDPLFAMEMEKCVESVIECNLYQYTGNNPVGRVDLDGLTAKKVAVTIVDKGVDLVLRAKDVWGKSQIDEGIVKTNVLNDNISSLYKSGAKRPSKSAASIWRKAGRKTKPTKDVDHKIDHQLGGDYFDPMNQMLLDSSVNRSFGSQIHHQLKNHPTGTKIASITFLSTSGNALANDQLGYNDVARPLNIWSSDQLGRLGENLTANQPNSVQALGRAFDEFVNPFGIGSSLTQAAREVMYSPK